MKAPFRGLVQKIGYSRELGCLLSFIRQFELLYRFPLLEFSGLNASSAFAFFGNSRDSDCHTTKAPLCRDAVEQNQVPGDTAVSCATSSFQDLVNCCFHSDLRLFRFLHTKTLIATEGFLVYSFR